MVLKGYYETNFQPAVSSHGSGRGIAASEPSLCSSSAPEMHTQDTQCLQWNKAGWGWVWYRVKSSSPCHSSSGMGSGNVGWEPAAACKVHTEQFPACLPHCKYSSPGFSPDKMELRQDGCLRQARWCFGAVWFCSGSRWAATSRRQLASPSERGA